MDGGAGELAFEREALALYAVAAALCLPGLAFLFSPAAGPLDRLVGWAGPVLLVGTLAAMPYWWDRQNWVRHDVRIQFTWYLLGVAVIGAASVVFVLYVETHGGTVPHAWFAVLNWAIGGGIVGLLLGLYDSERRRALTAASTARTAAERQGEQVQVLNRVLRHDIRNAVNIIRGHANLVGEAPVDRKTERSAAAIATAADDLFELAEHARQLETALDDSGGETVDVVPLLQRTVEQTRQRAPAAEFECHYDTSAAVVQASRFDIAFEQVLSNAVDHHPGTPHVEVAARERADGWVDIEIADDGCGLPDYELQVMGNREETQLQHSHGLGLWLSRWVVEANGGDLSVESSAAGTTVSIRLPMA